MWWIYLALAVDLFFIEGFISDLPQSIDGDIFHSSDLDNEDFWDRTSWQIMAEWSDQSEQTSIMQDMRHRQIDALWLWLNHPDLCHESNHVKYPSLHILFFIGRAWSKGRSHLHTKHWVPEISQKPVRMTKFWRIRIVKWTTLGSHSGGWAHVVPYLSGLSMTFLRGRLFYHSDHAY